MSLGRVVIVLMGKHGDDERSGAVLTEVFCRVTSALGMERMTEKKDSASAKVYLKDSGTHCLNVHDLAADLGERIGSGFRQSRIRRNVKNRLPRSRIAL
jgi:hypothetical protein